MQSTTQGATPLGVAATVLDAAALQRLRELDPSGNGAIFTRVLQGLWALMH